MRVTLSGAVAGLAAVAAAFAGQQAIGAEGTATPAAPSPRVAMQDATPLVEMAMRYAALVNQAGQLAARDLTSSASVSEEVVRAASVSTRPLGAGAAAYAASYIAGAPRFRQGVAEMADLIGRDAFVARLKADAAFAHRIAGADTATAAVGQQLGEGFETVRAAARNLTRQAYDSQRHAWAKAANDPQPRLDAMAAAAASPFAATMRALPAGDSDDEARRLTPGPHVVAAAAFLVLDEPAEARALLVRPASGSCVVRSQLTVRMCQRAARFPYEQMFCLAKHSLEETGGCVEAAVK